MSTVPPSSPPAEPPKLTPIDWLKELVIAGIALAVLVALLWTYYHLGKLPEAKLTTIPPGVQEQMANLKHIGTALFAVFGAIIGYYCGRVPAERSATAAQQAANAERALADREKDTTRRATALVAQARDRIAGNRAVAADASTTDPFLKDLDSFLRQRGWS